jgi:ABC-type antimicrobial peptide transport system permease subunit
VGRHLSRALQDYGFEASSTVARLAMLNAVQNTYISTFQVLGGFGLLIGSFGMGLVVARNVLERRGELALLHALGYRARQIRAIVLWEHAALFLAGTGIGLISALVAILPAISSGHGASNYRTVSLLLAAVVASGFLWTWLAARLALRLEWLEVLHEE